ncbi:MAG TPA: hypothetical protein VOA87_16840 [Thermoanaerobaculia bacterium]|nr:hypothetical protein [Thermoanaerobaculia bacterium]
MKSVKNKTHAPIRISLGQGSVLHLGPGKTGQIADHAAEHEAVQKRVKAGEIEVVDEGAHGSNAAGGGSSHVHESTHGFVPKSTARNKGDR